MISKLGGLIITINNNALQMGSLNCFKTLTDGKKVRFTRSGLN